MNTQYMLTLSEFMSNGEIFHMQMHLLYGLIDTMSATANIEPRTVLEMAKKYFDGILAERKTVP